MENHKKSAAHANAKVAEVVFLQEKTIALSLGLQEQEEAARRKMEVNNNQNVMTRVVDTIIFLGKQGLALRGHRESLTSEVVNTGNFLELLKLLSAYDVTICDHLQKVREQHEALAMAKIGAQSRGNSTKQVKGRGSKLSFLSN